VSHALLVAEGVSVHFPTKTGAIRAVEEVSFDLALGETLGIVGESGCGKSTLARALLRLIEPTAGSIRFAGEDLTALGARELRRRRRDMQLVFQDPFASLDPRCTVAATLEEPLIVHSQGDKASRRARVAELLNQVGLEPAAGSRYPHEFSGGQRQRIAIARAIALRPKLVIADEPVSALDVSIQSQIINLLVDLRQELGLAFVFISHDLAVVRLVSRRIAVMYLGRIVELATSEALFAAPQHPYTQALLAAIPEPVPGGRRRRRLVKGDIPSPGHPPSGCAFHPRCPRADAICRATVPALDPVRDAHAVRCFFPGGAAFPR
jgi:oligopeptide/dipeptide ABC transporter ATP-binding protein